MSNDKGTWFGWDVSKLDQLQIKVSMTWQNLLQNHVGKGEVEAKPEAQEQAKKSLNL